MLLGVVLVSELVSALWFEDVSFLNEQLLDTPIGRFSIRQMILLLFFGLLAWLLSLVFVDLVLKVVMAGFMFSIGAAFFMRKVKTVAPERHLFYVLKKYFLQITHKRSVVQGSGRPFESERVLLSAVLGVPVKVSGVLKDSSGKNYVNSAFKVTVNKTVYFKGVTDEESYFCIYFTPDKLGYFEVEIQPENTTTTTKENTTTTTTTITAITNDVNNADNANTTTTENIDTIEVETGMVQRFTIYVNSKTEVKENAEKTVNN